MTTIYFVRHGENDFLAKGIAGRVPGVSLNARGQAQADQVARLLAGFDIGAIYSSPLERAMETAEALSRRIGREVVCDEDLHEVDFGEWSGCTWEALDRQPLWHRWNAKRSIERCPGGESFTEVIARGASFLQRMEVRHPGQSVAAFGHGDPIRAIAMRVLGIPADFIHRLEIDTASVSAFQVGGAAPKMLFWNRTS